MCADKHGISIAAKMNGAKMSESKRGVREKKKKANECTQPGTNKLNEFITY